MSGRVVALTGGVGGAKLVLGLTQIMPPDQITTIVNTGDDFEHLGLWISPDIDTLLYTLSGKANPVLGWGREGESWSFMEAVKTLGGADWFQLGDGDLALHVLRSHALSQGRSLSNITRDFAQGWGIGVHVLPMSDRPVPTFVQTDEGELPFQDYFVRRRCEPVAQAVRFDGAEDALAAPGVVDAILSPATEAIIIAPSNPYLSIDPILAIPQIRAALQQTRTPIVAVSPIVGGAAVKGPTAKLMGEMGVSVTPATVAAHYAGIIDAMLVDERDQPIDLAIPHAAADTLMNSTEDKARVARDALELARRVAQ